jgi:hypothetical protein
LVFSFIDSQPAASIPIDGGLVVITEVISGGFFSESAVDRFFQVVNGALDRLIHGAFLMRYHYGLAPVAACFDHAAFVVMTGLVADRVAEVNIDPPDAVVEPVQRRMHKRFHVIGKLLAAFDVAVCPDLDQHRHLRRFIAWEAGVLHPALQFRTRLTSIAEQSGQWDHRRAGARICA